MIINHFNCYSSTQNNNTSNCYIVPKSIDEILTPAEQNKFTDLIDVYQDTGAETRQRSYSSNSSTTWYERYNIGKCYLLYINNYQFLFCSKWSWSFNGDEPKTIDAYGFTGSINIAQPQNYYLFTPQNSNYTEQNYGNFPYNIVTDDNTTAKEINSCINQMVKIEKMYEGEYGGNARGWIYKGSYNLTRIGEYNNDSYFLEFDTTTPDPSITPIPLEQHVLKRSQHYTIIIKKKFN